MVTSPNDGTDFPSGGTVHIAFSCNDVTSGVPASQCTAKLDGATVANNSNATVSFTGTHDFVVTAVDNAGSEHARACELAGQIEQLVCAARVERRSRITS